MKKLLIFVYIIVMMTWITPAFAQDEVRIINDKVTIVKAVVLEITSENIQPIPGTDITGINQIIKVKILEGEDKNQIVTLDNDYIELEQDEIFYLRNETRGEDGKKIYAVADQNRLPGIYFFLALFILAVIFLGGIQGIRGLVSLIGSMVLILYVLLPGILQGYSPIFMTIGVSSLIIIVGSYITHGFNKTTSSAVIGMIVTVIITGLLAYLAMNMSKLSGFSSEEETYLNLNTQGSIDMIGLLFGGIMIGLLGVLYDIAIGQAISVEELHHIAPHTPKSVIYKRGVRIGREHIGALVNTLAIAYVGVSLPLLLLFYTSNGADVISPLATINREIFATEIVRILIGSIGLVLAVPITTFIATWILIKDKNSSDQLIIKQEEEKLAHYQHHH
jgi:uncharacterized membrane protein